MADQSQLLESTKATPAQRAKRLQDALVLGWKPAVTLWPNAQNAGADSQCDFDSYFDNWSK